jgi:hypothetical protein
MILHWYEFSRVRRMRPLAGDWSSTLFLRKIENHKLSTTSYNVGFRNAMIRCRKLVQPTFQSIISSVHVWHYNTVIYSTSDPRSKVSIDWFRERIWMLREDNNILCLPWDQTFLVHDFIPLTVTCINILRKDLKLKHSFRVDPFHSPFFFAEFQPIFSVMTSK